MRAHALVRTPKILRFRPVLERSLVAPERVGQVDRTFSVARAPKQVKLDEPVKSRQFALTVGPDLLEGSLLSWTDLKAIDGQIHADAFFFSPRRHPTCRSHQRNRALFDAGGLAYALAEIAERQVMKIFAGLGNPGAKYTGNRHNIGFMVMDRIAEDHGFAPWRSKFQALVSDGTLGNEKVLLMKPQTFMNLSGEAVAAALRFYKLDLGELVVFHDELDLAPGKVRLKTAGGHAGHNGLRSILQHLGPDFTRVRLGIGHPGHKDRVVPYVLSDFARADQDWLDDLLRGVSGGAAQLAAGDTAGFGNAIALNRGTRDPAPRPKAKPKSPPNTAQPPDNEAPRSPLQKLIDRFR